MKVIKMKKKSYFILFSLGLLLFSGAFYLYTNHQNKELARAEFWEKQKPRIETFFRYNYKNIETFHYTGTSQDPMGISIEGYVNGDKELHFTATVAGYETQFNDNSIVSEELGRLSKEPGTYKTVDEIENEQ